MNLALHTNVSRYKQGNIRDAVSFAISNATAQAQQRVSYYERLCKKFEKKYMLASDEFMRQFEEGILGDEADFFDWYAAKRGLDLWQERYEILAGVSV